DLSPFLDELLPAIMRAARDGNEDPIDWWDLMEKKEIALKTLSCVIEAVGRRTVHEHLSKKEIAQIEEMLPTANTTEPISILACSYADKSAFVELGDFPVGDEETGDNDVDVFGQCRSEEGAEVEQSMK
ncbi:hypothetical protein PENTCL1PPCAC_3373, partial [Pristionchus entomophagus]